MYHGMIICWLMSVALSCSGGGYVAYAQANSDSNLISSAPDVERKKVVVLGTGWAGTSFLRNLKSSSYDVHVLSPRNYFAFTPLLPSVTCGTVEPRSIVEPIRNIVRKVIHIKIGNNKCCCMYDSVFWYIILRLLNL